MLRWRLVGATAIIIPVLGLLWMDEHVNFGRPGIWFAVLTTFFGIACCYELTQLFAQSVAAHRPQGLTEPSGFLHSGVVMLSCTVAMLVTTVPTLWPTSAEGCPLGTWGWPMLGLVSAVAIVMTEELRRFNASGLATQQIALSLLVVVYVVIPYDFIIHIRMMWTDRRGLVALVAIVFVAKLADSGAYFAGRLLGRTPLAPLLSPKKTVEGGIGGLLAAILAALVYFRLLVPWLLPAAGSGSNETLQVTANAWSLAGFGLSIAVAGVLGDLAISLFKRDAAQKDSARWLPGLGGFLDVMDSVMWAAPVGYLWWISGGLVS